MEAEAEANSLYANTALKAPRSFMLPEKLKPKEQTKYCPPKTSLVYTGWKNYILLHKSFCISLSTSIK